MSQKFEITAQLRQQKGTTLMRRLRREEDHIPAIIYGGGLDPQAISISHKDISLALEKEAIFSHILNLQLNDSQEQVVLKEVQRHPYKPRILHVDFQRIRANDKINVIVPIAFLHADTAKGVQAGGIVSHLITEVEIQCLPADLPETLDIDLTDLDVGESLHLSDLQLPAGVHLLGGEIDEKHDQTVVSIHLPRASVAESATESKENTAAAEE